MLDEEERGMRSKEEPEGKRDEEEKGTERKDQRVTKLTKFKKR